MALFYLIVLIPYLLICFIVYKRIKKSLKKYSLPKYSVEFIYWIWALSFIIYEITSTWMPKLIRIPLAYMGGYFLGFLFYSCLFFILTFLIEKIRKPKWDLYLISCFIVLIGIIPSGIYLQKHIVVHDYTIVSDKPLSRDYQIAVISDIHLGDLVSRNDFEHMVQRVNDVAPDLLIVAGDIVDSRLEPVLEEGSLELFSQFNCPVYVTLGNHDVYTGETVQLSNILTNYGVHVLEDEGELVQDELYLIGRNDSSFSRIQDEVSLDTLTTLDQKFQIVIDHNPARILESVQQNIDLHLSGHTHNGQLYPVNWITDYLFEVGYGYKAIDHTQVVVSSGIGSWGPKLRTSSSAEIIRLTITSKQ